MTLLAWRNHFTCDVLAERGTAHIESLCKWGPTTFTQRTRILPSGRPPEESVTLVEDDPTWELEYEHFKDLCARRAPTSLDNDVWLLRTLGRLSTEAIAAAASNEKAGKIGYVGMTHLGSARRLRRRARASRTIGFDAGRGADRRRLPPAGCRWSSRGSTICSPRNGERMTFTADAGALAGCDVVYVAPDVPTDDEGGSDLAPLEALLDLAFAQARDRRGARRAEPGAARLHARAPAPPAGSSTTRSRR